LNHFTVPCVILFPTSLILIGCLRTSRIRVARARDAASVADVDDVISKLPRLAGFSCG
jgi:hypothetical protein